ncbi:MAG TPA: hypothetical protein VK675_03560 [Candidatus Paceibacterota bacterium]|nr:hypothetical protein [Candidatus Paceibacterota bacterium]
MKFKVKIAGIAPLLQAKHPTPKEEQEILKRKSSPKAKVKDLTDKEQFDMHSYKTASGKFMQPSEMIEASLVKAATTFKMEGKKSYKDVVKGGLIKDPVEIVHENQKPELDGRWGRNKSTGGAVWVCRPCFPKWSLSFTIDLLQDERISPEMLKAILEYAGLYVGIGAWRPKFGRFEVISFSPVK